MHVLPCGGQRPVCRRQFSPSTLWGPAWDWTQIIRLGTSALPAEPSHQPRSPSFETKKLVGTKGEKKLSLLITSTASEQDLTHLLDDTGHSGRYINKNKYRRAEALSLWCLEYPVLEWTISVRDSSVWLPVLPRASQVRPFTFFT